ncbi:potassium channel family protein [Gracilinema caldarium]|uniref:TrkA-N domain protein n=1 Tax=Gracilinema caldarium (strain ATCC 51460 / DSM 7334 / H1) TaxID=744872 RepID=F8F2F4_GRAC1|nr:TrkA family potassium uptake protein [Gracilinema caldarium]AEJ20936.1 TrkA-N domain protein [Gracilinema caldarium DSM 7334]
MKQVAILGLSYFGQAVLDELLEMDVDILLIDKDREVLDRYRDTVSAAIGMDVINQEALEKTLPKHIDAVIIDMGKNIEASILAASYCKKLEIGTIIAKAETDAHGEILGIVGATKVVFPNREAAKRIVPQIVSNLVLNYLPVGGNLVIAEIEIPDSFIGKTVLELDLRKKFGLNLISVRSSETEYTLFTPEYRFQEKDIALVSGTEFDVDQFTGRLEKEGAKRSIFNSIREIFSKK